MKKQLINIICALLLTFISSSLYSQSIIAEKYSDKILKETELRATTDKAIEFIKTNHVDSLIGSFPKSISNSIPENQLTELIRKINTLIKEEGIPKESNIQPALRAVPRGKDTLFVNQIYYKFKSKILMFSFLKEFGSSQIAGMNLMDDPFSGNGVKPNFEASDKFEFDLNNLSHFRVYYKEIKPITKFDKNIGVFAVEGNSEVFKDSGLKERFKPIIKELSKSKFENKEIFNQLLYRGDEVEFIQAELGFSDKEFGLFFYMPIKGGKISIDNIILRQKQYSNLGYQYTLLKKDYPIMVKYLTEIIKMDLEKYYLSNP
nr:hypothetical protein [uncultured Allomuricauda sp.]